MKVFDLVNGRLELRFAEIVMESGDDLRLVVIADYEKLLKLRDSPLVTASYSGVEAHTKLRHQVARVRCFENLRHCRESYTLT